MSFIDFDELESIRDGYLDFSYVELCAEKRRVLSEDRPDRHRLEILNELIKDGPCENSFGQEE